MNSNGGLFGDLIEGIEPIKEEPVKKVEKKQGNNFYKLGKWNNTGYEQWGVLSSLIKEIRIGNALQALYRLQVMLHAGGIIGRDYVMKRLTIEASETFWGDRIVNYVNSVNNFFSMYNYGESDNLYHLILFMCFRGRHQQDVEYWRENRLGILLEPYYSWLIGYYVPGIFEGRFRKVEYPSYAMDRHTRLGKSIVNKGGIVDNRWSGTDSGRRKSIEIALTYDLDCINPSTDYPVTHHTKDDSRFVFDDYDKVPYKWFPKNVKELEEYYAMSKEDFKKFIFGVFDELEKQGIYNPMNF